MKYKKLIFGIVLFVLLVVGVFGQPPLEQTIYLDNSLTIETLDIKEHDLNTSFYLHAHVYSSVNGLLKNYSEDNVSCFYHMYSDVINWEHSKIGTLNSYGAGFYDYINKSYFNKTGNYAFLVWCECDGCLSDKPEQRVGGFTRFNFNVIDPIVSDIDYNYNYLIIGLLVLCFILSFVISSNILGLLTGIGALVYGLTIILNVFYIGLIVLIAGVFIMLYFGFKED